MLYQIAVGDAYGGGFEAADPKFIKEFNDLEYVNHPRKVARNPDSYNPSLIPMGKYTDDTQMSLAIAEAMLDENEPWTKESLANRFVEVFKRDVRRGYTGYFFKVLSNAESGKDMLENIDGKSIKSGAAMRAASLGLYPDIAEIIRKAEIQASVTHDSWLGRKSSVAVALMTHYFCYNLGQKQDLVSWLNPYLENRLHIESFEVEGTYVQNWRPSSDRYVRSQACDCLEAAIYAIETHDSISQILWQCVEYTGDVDTVAAIAMGPASFCSEIDQTLPDVLVWNLENNRFGADYLKDLDRQLLEKYRA